MLLSALFVRFRDVQPIWEVVTLATFYATPILYPLERVSVDWGRDIIMLNPLSVVVQQLRHAIFNPAAPSALEAVDHGWLLLIPIGLTFGVVRARLPGVQPVGAERRAKTSKRSAGLRPASGHCKTSSL